MMKKLLLTALTGTMACIGAFAQPCTPDPSYTPESETGAGISDLPCATINEPYNASSTIVIPPSIQFPIGGTNQTVYICKVTVTSIDNVPQSTSPVNPAIFYNGNTYGFGQEITLDNTVDRGCVNITGTFTELFDDTLRVQGNATVNTSSTCSGGFGLTVTFNAIPGASQGLPIYFAVKNAGECLASVSESMSNNSFDVAQNFPNPFNGESQIAYNLPQSGKVTFRITNLVGKTVKEINMNGNSGTNYINVNSAEYAAGVYMYSLTFDGKTVTKRMIIK